jgi:hypothetical protein
MFRLFDDAAGSVMLRLLPLTASRNVRRWNISKVR